MTSYYRFVIFTGIKTSFITGIKTSFITGIHYQVISDNVEEYIINVFLYAHYSVRKESLTYSIA